MSKRQYRKAAMGALWLGLVIASYLSGAAHVWAGVTSCTSCVCKNVNYWSTGDGKTYGMFTSPTDWSVNDPEAIATIYVGTGCLSGGPVQGTKPEYKWYWTGRTFKCGIQNGDSFIVECNAGIGTPTYKGDGATTQLVCSGN